MYLSRVSWALTDWFLSTDPGVSSEYYTPPPKYTRDLGKHRGLGAQTPTHPCLSSACVEYGKAMSNMVGWKTYRLRHLPLPPSLPFPTPELWNLFPSPIYFGILTGSYVSENRISPKVITHTQTHLDCIQLGWDKMPDPRSEACIFGRALREDEGSWRGLNTQSVLSILEPLSREEELKILIHFKEEHLQQWWVQVGPGQG